MNGVDMNQHDVFLSAYEQDNELVLSLGKFIGAQFWPNVGKVYVTFFDLLRMQSDQFAHDQLRQVRNVGSVVINGGPSDSSSQYSRGRVEPTQTKPQFRPQTYDTDPGKVDALLRQLQSEGS